MFIVIIFEIYILIGQRKQAINEEKKRKRRRRRRGGGEGEEEEGEDKEKVGGYWKGKRE